MSYYKKWILIAGLITAFIFGAIAYFHGQAIIPYFFKPSTSSIQPANYSFNHSPKIVEDNLTIPWEMVFLPGGDRLVTERPGTLRRFGSLNKSVIIPNVKPMGEGGLLGLTLDPNFINNRYLYLYITTEKNGRLMNEVIRYVYDIHGEISNKTVIFSNIPAARFHNGGRIKFGPDGYLYITTGDALSRNLAQNKHSLAGKILRITQEGKPAPGNPFNSPVYSYGHRNPQGIAWDAQGNLWETEHGESANDELNLIKPGNNYGWPIVQGQTMVKGIAPPIRTSGANETWAPGGLTYLNGRLYFGGLRGQTLYEATINAKGTGIKTLHGHFRKQYGRIRNVVAGPNNRLYFMTSNHDGRGWPAKNDDRIVQVVIPPKLGDGK